MFGCVFVMVIGVVMGVLCLLNNWIVVWFLVVYVEGFWNVLLLFWIIVIFVVFSELLF